MEARMRRTVIALLLIVAVASLPLEPAATANASETPGQLQPVPAQFDETAYQARVRAGYPRCRLRSREPQ